MQHAYEHASPHSFLSPLLADIAALAATVDGRFMAGEGDDGGNTEGGGSESTTPATPSTPSTPAAGTGEGGSNNGQDGGDQTRRRRQRSGSGGGTGSPGSSGSGSSEGGDEGDGDGDERRFTQAELDKKIDQRLARERQKFADYDQLKENSDKQAAEMAELRESLGKALGFTKDDTPPDPAALEKSLAEQGGKVTALEGTVAERDGTIRTLQVEIAAMRAAFTAGLNPVLALNSRTFYDSLAALDPSADGFAQSLDSALKAEQKANPALLITQAASAADAGIGTAGARGTDAAHVKPGSSRMRQAYENT